jgi:hypothetical protein
VAVLPKMWSIIWIARFGLLQRSKALLGWKLENKGGNQTRFRVDV